MVDFPPEVGLDEFDGAVGVDDSDASRMLAGDVQEALAHTTVEGVSGRLEAVVDLLALIASGKASDTVLDRQVEDNGEVGEASADGEGVHVGRRWWSR